MDSYCLVKCGHINILRGRWTFLTYCGVDSYYFVNADILRGRSICDIYCCVDSYYFVNADIWRGRSIFDIYCCVDSYYFGNADILRGRSIFEYSKNNTQNLLFFQNFDVNYRMIQIFKIQYLAMVVEMGCIMTASKSMIQRHKKLSAHNEQIKFWGPIFKIFISTNILKVSKLLFFCKIRSSRPHLPKWKDTICFFLKNQILKILDIIQIANLDI